MRFCPVCGKMVETYCDKCERRYSSSTARGYDSRWQRVRERVLDDQPLCADCEEVGRVTPAIEVHHIRPVKAAPHERLSRANLVPLCEQCHDARHGGKKQRGKERDYA